MLRRIAFVAALAASAAAAQDADLTRSPPCREALDALQARQDEAARSREADAPASAPSRAERLQQVESARRQAARACLGGTGVPPPPSAHYTQPLEGVPAPTVRPPPPPPRPAALPLPVPARRDPPPVVTSCDAGGCWASDGSRLPRFGPNLLGPRGVCTLQGVVVHCP